MNGEEIKKLLMGSFRCNSKDILFTKDQDDIIKNINGKQPVQVRAFVPHGGLPDEKMMIVRMINRAREAMTEGIMNLYDDKILLIENEDDEIIDMAWFKELKEDEKNER